MHACVNRSIRTVLFRAVLGSLKLGRTVQRFHRLIRPPLLTLSAEVAKSHHQSLTSLSFPFLFLLSFPVLSGILLLFIFLIRFLYISQTDLEVIT